ncbi:hypothetical protein TNCV_4510601 [Trichonephila clavipes]|nr:hypothetical protein TNCV_4510601 [Trichonephila clavipes]
MFTVTTISFVRLSTDSLVGEFGVVVSIIVSNSLRTEVITLVQRKNSGLCIRKCVRLQHCFRRTIERDSSSKPETDKSHFVRDQDCMVDGEDALNKNCNMVFFALSSPYHPTTERL